MMIFISLVKMLSPWCIVGFQQMFTVAIIISIITGIITIFFRNNVTVIRIFLLEDVLVNE